MGVTRVKRIFSEDPYRVGMGVTRVERYSVRSLQGGDGGDEGQKDIQ